ncbi:hypothetical protein [Paraburkholderia solisilvae]|uniref:Peptidase C39-like domain-containing protein n=1 Tax=Paraburkholderia solisilvae TaxID=624376 RepID=A0A6J5E1K1_9BURK|nr:hypothetical protein [Paraburkholderia solisilvae]CAB3759015.1 hypothetical protein LMG29739_03052 [Paraburkholderia solisilvae]
MNVTELDQNNWGVCGFVAAVQAAIRNNKTSVALGATTYGTLYPVIESFCKRHSELAPELLNFSAVFGNEYAYKNVGEVLQKMQDNTAMDREVGLAMTAAAVSQLCKDLGFTNANFQGTTATTNKFDPNKLPYRNAIYGIGKTSGGNYRYGLLHWIYVDADGSPYSWGKAGPDAVNELVRNGYNKLTHYLPGLN